MTNKWLKLKGLSKKNKQQILDLCPENVSFFIEKPYITCKIDLEHEIGVGMAICSAIEWEFDVNRGKNIAAGRAVKALKNQSSCEFVRAKWHKFPNTWTKAQMDRLIRKRNMAKCSYSLRDRESEFSPIHKMEL